MTVLLACSGGCGKKTATPARPPTMVQAVSAVAADVPVMADAFGRLRASSDVDIKPQVTGKIIEAPFAEGADVAKGAVLFRIEKDSYQAAYDKASAQMASAAADLELKRATLERNRNLLARSLIAQEDFDKLSTELDTAKAQLDQARAALAEARVNLDYCEITAPTAGRAGKRMVDPGNLVSAGSQVLVNIRSLDSLFLDFTLSESLLPEISRAMKAGKVEVLVTAESASGEPGLHQGELKMMDNAVDVDSGTIGLRAVVPNPDAKLWPGQFVYAFPVLRTMTNAVIVPQSAVTEGKSGTYVFIIQDDKAVLKLVERGPVIGNAVVVEKGLSADDMVVTAGQLGLWPGAPVKIKNEPDSAEKGAIDKRLADPNVRALAHVLSARGESAGELGLILGIPADEVKKLAGAGEDAQ